MTWVSLSDDCYMHPKVEGLSDRAFRVWVSGICYCNALLTDGHIPPAALTRLRASRKVLDELVAAKLWLAGEDGGAVVNHYLEYQPSRAKVEASRGAARERMVRHRNGNVTPLVRANNARTSHAVTPSVTPVVTPTPSHPILSGSLLSLPTDKNKPKELHSSSSEGSTSTAQVREVFEFWRENTGKTHAKLDRKREVRIRARLSEKFTVEDLKQAIANRIHDPWLMGKDPKSTRIYDGLETLLRDAAQVERLRDIGKSNGSASLPTFGGRFG